MSFQYQQIQNKIMLKMKRKKEIQKLNFNEKKNIGGFIMKSKFYVQGDLFLKEAEIPSEAEEKRMQKRGYVLAEGEATGHTHVIPRRFATVTKMYEHEGKVYLAVLKVVEIIHPEHKTLVLPIGNYEVGQVREYDAFEEETRLVRD